MTTKASFELHALNLGKLIGNLLSIEMGARMAIAKYDNLATDQFQKHLPLIKAGDSIEVNIFTSPDGLRQTLEQFNKLVPKELTIDVNNLVLLRDALAHGRAFGFGEMPHLRLLKFNQKVTNGRVVVELAQDMTSNWFESNIVFLNATFQNIQIALDYERKELR